jgi:hypothetical protein
MPSKFRGESPLVRGIQGLIGSLPLGRRARHC